MNNRAYNELMATAKGQNKETLLFAILGIEKA